MKKKSTEANPVDDRKERPLFILFVLLDLWTDSGL